MSDFDDVKGEDGLNEEDAVGLAAVEEDELVEDDDAIIDPVEIDPLADPVDDGSMGGNDDEASDQQEIENLILEELYGDQN